MATLGILGGGQLAKMTAQAASVLGIRVVIFAQKDDEPALDVTPHHIIGAWEDDALLQQFAKACDVITLESEFVDIPLLRRIESFGTRVYPSPSTLEKIQDKLDQKRTMQNAGIDVPRFKKVSVPTDILEASVEFGFPLVVKARRNGYDGYGNAVVNRAHEVQLALEKLQGRELMVEAHIPFVRELAVMIARDRNGNMREYPVVETVQKNGICHTVRCPAPIDEASAVYAIDLAKRAVEAVDGVGVFGVELFEGAMNYIVFNEIAPRPHNSGHYTIEGTITSQFENHVRAVMGLPLGDIAQIAPATVMLNILGERNGTPHPTALDEALSVEGAHIHLYGKQEVRVGRKMGHITVLGYDIQGAENVAKLVMSKLKL